MLKKLAAATLGLVIAAGIAWAQADPVADRIANRKEAYRTLRGIKKIIDDKGAPSEATAAAIKLVDLQKQFLTMFPAGSDKGETKALPVIWTDWAGFQKANKDAEMAATKLVDASKGTDQAALADAFKKYGASCDDCHDIYHRNK